MGQDLWEAHLWTAGTQPPGQRDAAPPEGPAEPLWTGPPAPPPRDEASSGLPLAPSLWSLRRRPPHGARSG
eukprot:3259002-Alexandrium_andersonii.AAC.1